MATADEEFKRNFADTSSRWHDLSRQLNNCKAQIFQRDRDRRMAELMSQELDRLEEGVKTYKAVGKMFILMERQKLKEETQVKCDKWKRDVAVLDKTREYLEKNVQDQQRTLEDLIKRVQAQKS